MHCLRKTHRKTILSHTKITKLLKANNILPCKLHPTPALCEEDPNRWIVYCEELMRKLYQHELLPTVVLFADESTLTLHEHVNGQNCR